MVQSGQNTRVWILTITHEDDATGEMTSSDSLPIILNYRPSESLILAAT